MPPPSRRSSGRCPGPWSWSGHSYGGPVITEAANGKANVKALVYVAGFAPDTGKSSLTLSAKFPGSTLGEPWHSVTLPDGSQDLYIRTDKFHEQFAADVRPRRPRMMAVTQRPVARVGAGRALGRRLVEDAPVLRRSTARPTGTSPPRS